MSRTRFLSCMASVVALATAASAQVRITEFMYSGADGEFIELTNVSASTVDISGWSLDDQSAVAGTFDLSSAGLVAPGASIVITDRIAANFIANWSLSGVVVLGGNALAPIGRNDAIHVFDEAGSIVDSITYGDEDLPGSVRPSGLSANVCIESLGSDDIYRWTLAMTGDSWASFSSTNGDVGSPGVHMEVPCPPIGDVFCMSNANSTGTSAGLEVIGSQRIALNDVELRCTRMPLNSMGFFLASLEPGLVMNPAGSAGNLCLSGQIGRYSASAMSSGTGGEISLAIDLTAMSHPIAPVTVMSGDLWHFQAWYRDSQLGIPISNFSDAAEVTFR